MSKKIKVLFICLGNICRSPMAENIFRQMVADAGLSDKIEVDSAGTAGYHVGNPPHPGTRSILAQYNIQCTGRSRQVSHSDLQANNSWIIAMDHSNMRDLQRLQSSHQNMHLLLKFADLALAPADLNVPDPYYTGNFEAVYQLVTSGCAGLLTEITKQEALL